MSGGRDCMVKYWDVSSLGKRQGVTTDTMVNEDGFPEVRSFLGHSVRFFFSIQKLKNLRNPGPHSFHCIVP